MDVINNKIINDKNLKNYLPTQFNKTVYTLTETIRYKIFDHKEFIKTLDTQEILDNMKNLLCNSTPSPFTNPNHWYILTGDIRIVQHNKLRKLYLTKFSKLKQVLKDPKVISYLNILQEQHVMYPIDKAANNIAFICKKYYIQYLNKIL